MKYPLRLRIERLRAILKIAKNTTFDRNKEALEKERISSNRATHKLIDAMVHIYGLNRLSNVLGTDWTTINRYRNVGRIRGMDDRFTYRIREKLPEWYPAALLAKLQDAESVTLYFGEDDYGIIPKREPQPRYRDNDPLYNRRLVLGWLLRIFWERMEAEDADFLISYFATRVDKMREEFDIDSVSSNYPSDC